MIHENKPELEHFGVKGMRWGVRKKRGASEKTKSQKVLKNLTRVKNFLAIALVSARIHKLVNKFVRAGETVGDFTSQYVGPASTQVIDAVFNN